MKYNINLLSKKELSFFDKAVYFSLNYLRYILVITQLVVIGVLFYRFKIDNDIIELKEAISQKQEIVKVTEPLLNEVEKLDVQVAGISTSTGRQDNLNKSLDYLTTVFPQSAFLTNFTVQNKTYKLVGNSPDAATVQAFYARLKKDAFFKSVLLENLEKQENGTINFSMTLN